MFTVSPSLPARRRGCGRTLPACPNCRRQGQEFAMGSWYRGNDGRLVARGGHQRGILSVRSRKVDLANKRAGHHPVKKHSFILSLPRGLSLARLVRGDKSCYRQSELFFSCSLLPFASVSTAVQNNSVLSIIYQKMAISPSASRSPFQTVKIWK